MANSLYSRSDVPSGPELPNLLSLEITLKPGVIFDSPLSKQFGDVLTDAYDLYYAGTRVKVRFVGANPRNDLKLGETFLTIEKLDKNSTWNVVATDGNWDTM